MEQSEIRGFPGASVVKNPPAVQETQEGQVQSWRGHGNPLEYSCLGNPMERGAWWIIVHRVAKSWTQLKRLSTHAYIHKSFPGGSVVKNQPANAGDTGDKDSVPGSGRSP